MVKQERSKRTLEQLVRAAAEEFERHGFAGATLLRISGSAGVTKGALFFHFATKDELADAVRQRCVDDLDSLVEELRGAGRSPLQILVDLTYRLGLLLREDPFARAGVRLAHERRGAGAVPPDFHELWLGRVWGLLDEARGRGELSRTVTDDLARSAVTAVVSGVETLAWMGKPYPQAERWLSGLWGLLLPLLVSPGSLRALRAAAPDTEETRTSGTG
ncbi:ScbR family autoregulator-binding transcription factor [Streptomyces sp. CNQ085]|uniref:ScbR family autoregulator-binding transcription factor n=1 Tax=Streptomyces sp. CNQ085 TaxID=2886944 RepID=UPI001F514FD3|nr:ScbR family autoregulator-binding transcription factor [Streptomyces sp. CNQ085]MCI0385825.1 TetR/AcrR family transcriptional regulator [Streptomyces sp. CNQ085]